MRGMLALVNGRVVTMDEAHPRAEAVLVADGLITRVGTTAEILAERTSGADVVDLRGRVLLPGFIDTHVHLMATGLALIGLPLEDCRSLTEVLSRVQAAAQGATLVHAVGLDPHRLADGRYPTLRELDEAAPDCPAYLVRRDMHSAALNSKALALVPMAADTPGLERDPGGKLTGVLRGEAWDRASIKLSEHVDDSMWRAALRSAVEHALAVGVTTVHALEGGFTSARLAVETVADYARKGPGARERRLKVVLWWQTTDVDAARERGLSRIGGCILVDGSFGSQTAALNEPYADRPDWQGNLYLSDEELEGFIGGGHAAGMQVAVHAIGDRAVAQALRAYRKVLNAQPRADHRHRIEHFMLPSVEDVRLAAELGIHLGVQPAFLLQWGGERGMYQQRLGPAREERLMPLREMLGQGAVLGGGSDSTVTPLNPLLGIQAAVTAPYAPQRLTAYEALRLYTADAARLSFEEKEKGTIAPGMAADLVVLADDPLSVLPGEIAAIPVEMTIVDGEQAWP